MSTPHPELIGLAGGRAFTLRLSDNTDRKAALDWLTGRSGSGQNNAPDGFLQDDWLETVEGFRVRRDVFDAWVIGHKEGEWAVAE